MLNLFGSMSSDVSAAEIVVMVFAVLAVFLIANPLREYSKGLVACALGDDTPRESGQLTLNPLAHIDLIGAISLLLFGIGWAKPIPINPARCSKVKPKTAMALTSVVGPLVNLLLAYIFVVIYKIILYGNYAVIITEKPSVPYYLMSAAYMFIVLNIYFAVFNLLPIPPFDGSRLILAFLPDKAYFKIMQYGRVFSVIIIIALFMGLLSIPLTYLSNIILKGLYYATGYVEFLFGI